MIDLTLEKLAELSALKEPHAMYVSGEDGLVITSLSSSAGAVVLTGRFLEIDGRIRPIAERAVLGNDRSTVATKALPLGEGWLLNLTAVLESGSVGWAQAFVRVDLVRGRSGGTTTLATLMQGTVTDTQRRAWPGSPIVGTLEAPGAIRAIVGTDPAAGAELSETVPAGARWRLLALNATLVTDANVANRRPVFYVDDGTNVLLNVGTVTDITASSTIPVNVHPGIGNPISSAGVHDVPLPPGLMLLAGYRIRTVTTLLQAGDNWSAPRLLVEEWLEGI